MRNRYSIFFAKSWAIAVVLMLVAACTKVEDDLDFSSQVSLKASIGPTLSTTYTKGIGEISSTYSGSNLGIGVVRTHGDQANFDDPIGCYEATLGAPSVENMGLRDISFSSFQGFPDGSTKVNYVGWYPYQGAAYTDHDSGKTTVTIPVPDDAYTDILYSNIASGYCLMH